MSLPIPVCAACGAAAFPPRVLCPRCGSSEWAERPVESGIVEAVTEREGTLVAAVRTPVGPVVIVRLVTDARPGQAVPVGTIGFTPVESSR